jgi:hypothetical protein
VGPRVVGMGLVRPEGDRKERTLFVAVDSYAIALTPVSSDAGAGNSMGLTLDARGARLLFKSVARCTHTPTTRPCSFARAGLDLRSGDDNAE